MILPTSIFDFVQDTNDFYFPPLVGSYLRFVRALVSLFTMFMTPVWYLLIKTPTSSRNGWSSYRYTSRIPSPFCSSY